MENEEPLTLIFTLNAPKTIKESDFNSLILKIEDLRQFTFFWGSAQNTTEYIESKNRLIEEIQLLLNNFKTRVVE